ncbi:MAG: PilW family protein [Thermodesulfobacteriota bacterium]
MRTLEPRPQQARGSQPWGKGAVSRTPSFWGELPVRRDTGFTLLEILVAMGLLFLVLATIYESFRVHVQSMERALRVHRFNQVARLALSMMARDLQSVFWPTPSVEEIEEMDEEEEGQQEQSLGPVVLEEVEDQEAYFLVQPMEEDGRHWDRLIFLSQAPLGGPFPNRYPWVHAVEYRLARDQDTGKPVLVRREDLAPGRDITYGGEEWALSEAVVGLEVVCISRSGQAVREWDSRVRGSLPATVLVRLWVGDPLGEPTLYTLRVMLPPSLELPTEEEQ